MNKKHFLHPLRGMWLSLLLCLSMVAFAQTTATGIVVDATTGETIIGASVLEKGTTNGTVTDFDGNFTLGVQTGATLSISYMGYVAQEVAAGENLKILLSEDTQVLQEVVAIGYGSQTKKEITGSVSSIKADDFNKGSFNSAEGLLQGKVAGLTMSKDAGGDPTSRTFNVQIRGTGSLTGSTTPSTSSMVCRAQV